MTARGMREVVEQLRETDPQAVAELAELSAATSEILLNAQRLAGAMREVAGEVSALVARHEPERAIRLSQLVALAGVSAVALTFMPPPSKTFSGACWGGDYEARSRRSRETRRLPPRRQSEQSS